ncbi:MAG: hypothetical protein A3F68_05055 [Acidobacteria bacterium RIFCSPLOWO2_12_FULL_54_10]|nr:MAG: hypothetical protein A3F68_05055 [Acidobacteria bacterium RIFCSPLOWO2_12_FULL_54_10]
MYVVVAMLGLSWFSIHAHAVGANAEPYELQQPNGIRFWARSWGDEWQNGTETTDGYTILNDRTNGWWAFAARDGQGNLVPSTRRVGELVPSTTPRYLRADSPTSVSMQQLRSGQALTSAAEMPVVTGNHKLLVIVVDFTPSISLGTTEQDWEQFFYSGGLPNAPRSVNEYWRQASYESMSLEPAAESYGSLNNGIVAVTLQHPHPDSEPGISISSSSARIVRDAIYAADPYVNFASLDKNQDQFLTTDEVHIFLVIRGYEQSYGGSATCSDKPHVWAHRSSVWNNDLVPVVDNVSVAAGSGWSSTEVKQGGYLLMGEWHCSSAWDTPGHMATIGVAVHELGHDIGMGAPDLYDTMTSFGTSSNGIGKWSLMASGSWNGKAVSGLYGTHPALPDPWVRSLFGFITPEELLASTPATLPQIESAVGTNRGVLQVLPNPGGVDWVKGRQSGMGEYFLIENRQRTGYFDIALPGDGVLIWHVDESALSFNMFANSDEGTAPPGNSRLVTLVQADGRFDLECYSNPPYSSRCNEGDNTDPWKIGGATTFSDASTPNSRLWDGTTTGWSLMNISSSAPIMSAFTFVHGSANVIPTLQPDSVVNAATFRPSSDINGALSPGTIVSIFGLELAAFPISNNTVPVATTLGETSVYFNGLPAPLFYVSNSQINAQVPYEVAIGTATLQVQRGTMKSAVQTIRIVPVSPGIFRLIAQGVEVGAILHADTAQLVTRENPARPGEFLSIYATGLGSLRQQVSAERVTQNAPMETVILPLVNISNIPVRVTYSGIAPGLTGVYQVNVQVPENIPAGSHSVQIFINSVSSNLVPIILAR